MARQALAAPLAAVTILLLLASAGFAHAARDAIDRKAPGKKAVAKPAAPVKTAAAAIKRADAAPATPTPKTPATPTMTAAGNAKRAEEPSGVSPAFAVKETTYPVVSTDSIYGIPLPPPGARASASRDSPVAVPLLTPRRKQQAAPKEGAAGPGFFLPPLPPHVKPPGNESRVKKGRLSLSFTGLTAADSIAARPSFDPPDQGLCVGNGFVLETVNSMLAVYDAKSGDKVVGPIGLQEFTGLGGGLPNASASAGPQAIEPNAPGGNYLSDPSCYYDAHVTKRWYHIAFTPYTTPQVLVVSASKTSDPTKGWNHYYVDADKRGDQVSACAGGCLPDYPQMAVYPDYVVFTTNEFDNENFNFFGTNLYVMPTTDGLAAGKQTVNFLVYPRLGLLDNGTVAFSNDWNVVQPPQRVGALYHLWPATVPNGGPAPSAAAPAWLAANLFFPPEGGYADLFVFSLANAAMAAASGDPGALDLTAYAVPLSNNYTWIAPPGLDEVAVPQRSAPLPKLPLLACIRNRGAPICNRNTNNTNIYPAAVSANGNSVYGAALGGGKLHVVWHTGVRPSEGVVVGTAWATIDLRGGTSSPKTVADGVIVPPGTNSVLFPNVAVDAAGDTGVVALSLVGPDQFPSAAFALIKHGRVLSDAIYVAAAGAGPSDSFTGYRNGFSQARWGDYSAAATDEFGHFWFASEFVAQTCLYDAASNGTCPDADGKPTRSRNTNWATRVSRLTKPEILLHLAPLP